MKRKILIADDEECIRYTFSDFLTSSGYSVQTADTLSGCIKKLQTEPFDLLFLDVGLGRENGIEAIEGIKVLQPDCEVVIITGTLDSRAISRARHYGAVDYVVKPIHEASLQYLVRKTLGDKGSALPSPVQ